MNSTEFFKNAVLAGAGGHALSLLEITGSEWRGYLSPEKLDTIPLPWLGDDSSVTPLALEGCRFHMAFVYAGLPLMEKRRLLIKYYIDHGAKFISVIAPSAIVTPSSVVGDGCAVMHRCLVNRSRLGSNVVLNSGAIIEHDCQIGSNTFIGPGVTVGGFVSIGSDCFIGLGSCIKNGVTIGDGVTIAMGATVTRDILLPGIYHGPSLKRFVPPHLR